MAGRGPVPGTGAKSPEQRRRRNLPPAVTELPADGYQGDFPALPPSWRQEFTVWERDAETREKFPVQKAKRVKYLPATRAWYETFARSPMATLFTATDWTRLRELAPLKDRYNRGDHTVASEIRQQETLLGATVADRKRLGVKIGDQAAPDAEEKPAAKVRRLRAVDPAA